jgi:pantoate--beta-alanine ligase
MTIALVATAHDFRRACQEARLDGELALVPTMGFLHRGHQSLIEAATQRAPFVAATIFVNPTQFGPSEDLSRYPRDLEGDLRKCEESGAKLVFAPRDNSELYPPGFQSYVEPGPLAGPLDGAKRPGHFRGVCTIVAKLFALSRADCAFFGEKDYQQLAIIKRMALDLNFATEVIGRPIVREPDGLAMSSRNSYLDATERAKAVGLYRALQAARKAFAGGESDIEAAARAQLHEFDKIDYCELRHPIDLTPVTSPEATSRLFLAAWLGKTRLIDNGPIHE